MGSGLSMASVNKIKELAGAHEYGLALDIVDSQDLSKSLNPQFLRLCGDIYTYNGRYTDARKVLLMAHRIAPEAKRIIFSLMELYIKLGYRELAKKYYDMYLFDADIEAPETKQLLYVYKKANHAPVEELEKYIGTEYLENIDYEWSYETFLVYTLLDKQQEALSLALEYTAHYTDASHCHVVADVLEGLISVEDVFYPDMPDRQDDDPDQEEIRQQEQKLLEADNLRMYPPEPEIVSMVDDHEDIIDFGAKRKRKRFMKEQSEESSETASETDDAGDGQLDENLSEEESGSFMKRAFSKFRLKRTEDENTDSEQETPADTEISADKTEKEAADSIQEITPSESEDEEISSVPNFVLLENPETDEPKAAETVEEAQEHDISKSEDERADDSEDLSDIQEMINSKRQTTGDEHGGTEDAEMKEHFWNKHNARYDSVVTDDLEEDSFEAEADSVEGLHEEGPRDDAEPSNRRKSAVVFEDATLVEEDDDDTPVDDFSSYDDDEFGAMNTVDDDEYDGVFVGEVEGLEDEPAEDVESDAEAEIYTDILEEADTEDTESAAETVTEYETETEAQSEAEVYESSQSYAEEEASKTDEPETDESKADEPETDESKADEPEADEPEADESKADEPEADEPETDEPEADEPETDEPEADEPEADEPEIGEPEADEPEADEPEIGEPEADEPETDESKADEPEADEFETDEPEADEFETDEPEIDVLPKKEPAYEPWKDIKKSNLDFPVFRSSLFPEYHSDTAEVENRFEEIMEENNSKLQENLLKEEQLQRETEALLASLGIDFSFDTKPAAAVYEQTAVTHKDTAGAKKGPSRDELKASLKIDSAKKDILRKIKEYR